MAGVAMTDHPPVRAPLTGISWHMRVALCALAGGPATYLRGVYVDAEGRAHMTGAIKALVDRKLADRIRCGDGRRIVRLTTRGRWFSATILGEMADLLALAADGERPERAAALAKTGTEG
jgi:hypothetical protein